MTGIEDGNVRWRTNAQGSAIKRQNLRGILCEQLYDMRNAHVASMVELFKRQSKRSFQPDDAKRATLEFLHFFVARMGSVIGSNRVDRAAD